MPDDVIQIALEVIGVDESTKGFAGVGTALDQVGAATEVVNNKLKEYGVATDDVTRTQNQLKQAQLDLVEASNRLSQAQKELTNNTDPSKTEELNKALVDAQVQLDSTGKKVQDLSKDLIEGSQGAKESAQGFESFAGKLVAVQAGIGIAKEALSGLKEVWDFAKEGAANQQIAESFGRTAKSIGANADDIIAKLDEAAKGTVDDEELMQASTRALTLGVAKNGDDLVNVMKLSRAAALQFGGDASQAFETINYAIGNLAPRALKQYGIIVSLKESNDAYAKSIGTTADQLTEEQQRQGLLNAVLEQGAKNFGDLGNSAATTAEKMKAVETRIANIVDIAKEVAATGFSTLFNINDSANMILDAFTGTAKKMREEVAAGRMSVKDYNDALQGMAGAMTAPGGVTVAVADAALATEKLTEDQARQIQVQLQVTQGAYGYASALDESNRAIQRSADTQRALQLHLREVEQGARNQADSFNVLDNAMDSSTAKANLVAASQKAIAADMADLKTVMAGALKNEITSFNTKQDDLADKAKKVRDELDKLQASQGAAVSSTKKHAMSANEAALAQLQLAQAEAQLAAQNTKVSMSAGDQAAAQQRLAVAKERLDAINAKETHSTRELTAAQANLAAAQSALANNTDPLKQAELAVKVDKLKESLGGATGAVISYVDNSKKIAELQGQYDAINAEIEANAKAHEDATRRILFGYAEQQVASKNLGDEGFKALDALAVRWGLKSQEDINAMQRIRDAAAGLAKDGSINEFVGAVDRGAGQASTIFSGMTQDIKSVTNAQADLSKTLGVPLAAQAPVDLKVTTDSAQAALHSVGTEVKTTQDKIAAPVDFKVTTTNAQTALGNTQAAAHGIKADLDKPIDFKVSTQKAQADIQGALGVSLKIPAPKIDKPVIPTPALPAAQTIPAPKVEKPTIPAPAAPTIPFIPTPKIEKPIIPTPTLPTIPAIPTPLITKPVIPLPELPIIPQIPAPFIQPPAPVPVNIDASKVADEADKAHAQIADKLKEPVSVPVTANVKVNTIQSVAGDDIAERAAQLRAQSGSATTQAQKDYQAFTTGLVSSSKSAIDTTQTTANTALTAIQTLGSSIGTQFQAVSSSVITAMQLMGGISSNQLKNVANDVANLPTFKEFIYKITVKGEIPKDVGTATPAPNASPAHGAAYGADFIVPMGYPNDTYPLRVSSGERVTVQTQAQQVQSGANGPRTVINNNQTYVLQDSLSTKIVLEQQRMERIQATQAAM